MRPDRALPHASDRRDPREDEPAGRGDAVVRPGAEARAAGRGRARGQADLLAAAGRRVEAAELLDRLADVLDGSNRLADASDAARRALELAESRERRRQVEAYATRLKASAGDEAAAAALARVLRVLEPPIAPAPVVAAAVVASDTEQPETEPVEALEPEPAIEPETVVLAEAVVEAVAEDEDQATEAAESVEATEEALEAEMATELDAEPPSEAIEETAPADAEPAAPEPEAPSPKPNPSPSPNPSPNPSTRSSSARAAEEALARGDAAAARDGLLAAAAAHREAGRSFAAIDACYLALAVAPADVDLHLMLTRALPRARLARPGRRQAAAAGPARGPRRGRATPGPGSATSRPRSCRTSRASPTSSPEARSLTRRGPGARTGARCYTHGKMEQLLRSVAEQVKLNALVDIGITALLIYWLFSLIRGTRAVSLVIGVTRPVRGLRRGPRSSASSC